MDEMSAPTDQRLQRQWIFRRPDVFTVHKLCLEKTRLPPKSPSTNLHMGNTSKHPTLRDTTQNRHASHKLWRFGSPTTR